jgi:hypothetical protein
MKQSSHILRAVRRYFAVAVTTLALASLPMCAQVGYTTVSGNLLHDASGVLVTSATISFQPTDNKGNIISFRVGTTGGQTVSTPVSAQVVNGVFSVVMADTTLTNPVNPCYAVTITSNLTGSTLPFGGYSCIQPSGSAWSLDSYTPNLAAQSIIYLGPTGPAGPSGAWATPGTIGSVTPNTGAFTLGSFVGTTGTSAIISTLGSNDPTAGGGYAVKALIKGGNGGGGTIGYGLYVAAPYDGTHASGANYSFTQYGLYVDHLYGYNGLDAAGTYGIYQIGGASNYFTSPTTIANTLTVNSIKGQAISSYTHTAAAGSTATLVCIAGTTCTSQGGTLQFTPGGTGIATGYMGSAVWPVAFDHNVNCVLGDAAGATSINGLGIQQYGGIANGVGFGFQVAPTAAAIYNIVYSCN